MRYDSAALTPTERSSDCDGGLASAGTKGLPPERPSDLRGHTCEQTRFAIRCARDGVGTV